MVGTNLHPLPLLSTGAIGAPAFHIAIVVVFFLHNTLEARIAIVTITHLDDGAISILLLHL